MRFKKTLCGVTAALTVLSSTAIAAQAEETQLKLLTASIESGTFSNYGGGYYWDGKNVLKISENEIVGWRETGTLSTKAVDSDVDFSGLTNMSGSFDGGYYQFAKKDAEGGVTERYVTRLNKEKNKLETAFTLGSDWCYTCSDGYTFGCKQSGNTLEISVYDDAGRKSTATLPYAKEEFYWRCFAVSSGENIGYVMVQTAEKLYDDISYPSYELYAVKKNASLELIAQKDMVPMSDQAKFSFGLLGAAENCAVFVEWDVMMRASAWKLYSVEDGKVYEFYSFKPIGETYNFICDGIGGKIYDSRIIVTSGSKEYVLFDFKANKSLSKKYASMSTNDGKIYLVKTDDSKWGYIDENGKELALFDDAGGFMGEYAPVIKDGKAYLIDRNMNKVSEEIAADSVGTLGEGLFRFNNGDGITLFTYADADKPSDPTTSEPVSSEPTTSEPTSSTASSESSAAQPEDDNNPATGIAIALIPVILLGGAAVVVTKKRNK